MKGASELGADGISTRRLLSRVKRAVRPRTATIASGRDPRARDRTCLECGLPTSGVATRTSMARAARATWPSRITGSSARPRANWHTPHVPLGSPGARYGATAASAARESAALCTKPTAPQAVTRSAPRSRRSRLESARRGLARPAGGSRLRPGSRRCPAGRCRAARVRDPRRDSWRALSPLEASATTTYPSVSSSQRADARNDG